MPGRLTNRKTLVYGQLRIVLHFHFPLGSAINCELILHCVGSIRVGGGGWVLVVILA